MNTIDNFERSLRHYKIVSRAYIGILVVGGLCLMPSTFLGYRNGRIDRLRNEPIIKTCEELEKFVQKSQKELNLADARFDVVVTNNNYHHTCCGMVSNNHYVLIFREEDKKPYVVEHEMFHAHEMQTGKLNCDTRGLKRILSSPYFFGEWRAQNYCLRNYKEGKKIK